MSLALNVTEREFRRGVEILRQKTDVVFSVLNHPHTITIKHKKSDSTHASIAGADNQFEVETVEDISDNINIYTAKTANASSDDRFGYFYEGISPKELECCADLNRLSMRTLCETQYVDVIDGTNGTRDKVKLAHLRFAALLSMEQNNVSLAIKITKQLLRRIFKSFDKCIAATTTIELPEFPIW
jgi:hypothetical protein